jgi:membrane protease YdiL (CAAX protease family)
LATASGLAGLVVAADLALVWWKPDYPENAKARIILALLALVMNIWLVHGDLMSLGLRLPTQGWWYWVRVSALLGLAITACVVVGLGVWVLLGHELPVYTMAPGDVGEGFVRMCVYSSMVEETIYRLTICIPLAVLLSPWKAITVSGFAFGGLHVLYGNPSPENLVGGFFLAWVYLSSESIAVPVCLHGLGNLCVLAMQVGAWYWLGSG